MEIDNKQVFRSSLYNFLKFAIENPSEKMVLDCGAGGSTPPLSLFYSYGFKTYGIDISEDQIKEAIDYCTDKKVDLNIKYGDMRDIPFIDGTFGYVYSIYSSIHLSKKDTGIAIREMERVLKKGGLLYINFLTKEDQFYGAGEERNPGECTENFDGEEVLHSYYEDDEPDAYFIDSEIIYKEKRKILIRTDVPQYRSCTLDYIAKKK